MPRTKKRISIGGAPLTQEVARTLRAGQWLYSRQEMNSNGAAFGIRVTSVQTCKREPNFLEIRVVRGQKDFFQLHTEHLQYWSTEELSVTTEGDKRDAA